MFKTSRLIVKPWHVDQTKEFLELSQDAGFTLFPITPYRQESLATAREWIERAVKLNQETGMGKWGVWDIDSGKLIGLGGLTPWNFKEENLIDITYRLRESAWGKGHGIELARGLVSYGINELKLPQITATITPDNEASKAIAQKLGFKFDQKIVLLGVPTDLYRLF